MIETGDFWTPYFNCVTRLEKPILTYWAVVLSYKLFGISDWAARIPTIFVMSILLFAIFYIVKREFGERVAVFSTLFFATNFQIYIYTKAVVPEPYLLVFNALSTFSFYYGIKDNSKKDIIIGYIFAGLAFLTKGPLGLIIPFGINIPYFFVKKGFKNTIAPLLNMKGIIIFLLINLPWYGMMIKIHGMKFIDEFFIVHNLKRFSGGASMHLYPFYYYIPVILLALFFWLAYLPNFLKYLSKPKFTDMEKFLLWWAVFVFIFFSLSKNKLHHYIIIMHPPISILMAICFEKLEGKRLFSNVILIILFVTETLFLFLGKGVYKGFDYNLTPLLTFMSLSTLTLMIVNNLAKKEVAFYLNIVFFFVLTLFLMHYGETIKERSMRQYEIIKGTLGNRKLYSYKRNSEDINFYVNTCTEKIDSLSELETLIKKDGNFYLIVHEKHLKEFSHLNYSIVAKTTTFKNIGWYILAFKN